MSTWVHIRNLKPCFITRLAQITQWHNDDTHYPILYKKGTLQLPRKPDFARIASILPRYRDFQCRARNRAEGLSKFVGTKDFGRLSLSVSLHLLLNPVELLGIREVTNLNDGCSCDASKVMTHDLLLDSLTDNYGYILHYASCARSSRHCQRAVIPVHNDDVLWCMMINDACGSRWFQICNDNNDDYENECSSSALVNFALFHPKTSELPTRKFTKIVSFWKGELSSQKSLSSKSSSFSATQKCLSLPDMWHLLPTWEAKWHLLLVCTHGSWGVISPQLTLFLTSFIGDITTSYHIYNWLVGASPGAMVAKLPSAADVSDEVPQLHLFWFQKKTPAETAELWFLAKSEATWNWETTKTLLGVDFLYLILLRTDIYDISKFFAELTKKYIQVDPIDLSNPNTFTVDFNMMSLYFCSVWMLGNSLDRDTPMGP